MKKAIIAQENLKSVTITVRLTKSEKEAVERIAKVNGKKTFSGIMRWALKEKGILT